MKQKLAICLLGLLPALGFCREIPGVLNGVWATPNCATPTDTLVIFRSFYLWLGDDETALNGLTMPDAQPDGWTRLEEPDGYPNFFNVLPDGRMRESFLPDNADMSESPAAEWQTTDYENCGGALPRSKVLLHGEPVAVMKLISDAQGQCSVDRQACANKLFAGVDVSGDDNLSVAEISRLFRVAGYVATVSQDVPANNDELASVAAASLPVAPLMASAIVSSFDYNDDGVLSMRELTQDRGTLFDQLDSTAGTDLNSRLNQMKQALEPLGRLLENLGR